MNGYVSNGLAMPAESKVVLPDPRNPVGSKRRDYGQARVPAPKTRLQKHKNQMGNGPGWYQAIIAMLAEPAVLSMALNGGRSKTLDGVNKAAARAQQDDALAATFALHSRVSYKVCGGREFRVARDLLGFPPSTFSELIEVKPGQDLDVVSNWYTEGMNTLAGFAILAPETDDQRRIAHFISEGPLERQEKVYGDFVEAFAPALTEYTFGPDNYDGAVRLSVVWEITEEEAAWGLGVAVKDPYFQAILSRLELFGRQMKSMGEPPRRSFA